MKKSGGGLCVYVKNIISILLLEIFYENSRIFLANTDAPLDKKFHFELEKILNDLSLHYSQIIVVDYFNVNLLKASSVYRYLIKRKNFLYLVGAIRLYLTLS